MCFFQAQNAPKPIFDRGSAPDPVRGAYDAPLDPLVGWGGGHPLPILLPFDAFGVSVCAGQDFLAVFTFVASHNGSRDCPTDVV